MEETIKNTIEQYQCSGCISGYNIECFVKHDDGIGCGQHTAGTFISGIGKVFMGMPKGFNRLGPHTDMKPSIFKTFNECEWNFNEWNIPVWKYLSKDGHTFVRGISPRKNLPFVHVYLEDCMDKFNCTEITKELHDYMD